MNELKSLLIEATSLLYEGAAERALNVLDSFPGIDLLDPEAQYIRALCYAKIDRRSESTKLLAGFLAHAPRHPNAAETLERLLELPFAGPAPVIDVALSPEKTILARNAAHRSNYKIIPDFKDRNSGQTLGVSILKDAAVLGRHSLIATTNGEILVESTAGSRHGDALGGVFGGGFNSNDLEIKPGDHAVLAGLWCDGYWHWMVQWLPRVVLCEAAGFTGNYLVYPNRPHIIDSLELLGIELSRLRFPDGQSWRPETLWVPDLGGLDYYFSFPEVVEEMRARILSNSRSGRNSDTKLFIPRLSAEQGRRISNQDEVWSLLQRYGFTQIDTNALTLSEQIQNFSSASIVVGPHGGAFTNILFMPARSTVIELFSEDYINPSSECIVRALKHTYYPLIGRAVKTRANDRNDMIVNCDELKNTLERSGIS